MGDQQETGQILRAENTLITDWYPILNWTKQPNYGDLDEIESCEDFMKNYYYSNKIKIFEGNLLETLTGGRHAIPNIRIMGCPGAGKTSFLHFLERKAANGHAPELNDFLFHICVGNRAAFTSYEEVERSILIDIIGAWKRFFGLCKREKIYQYINPQNKSTIGVASELIRYYKNHKKEFASKTLIFMVDQADLIDDDQVTWLTRCLMMHLGDRSIKKWIALRDETFKEYSPETKNFIRGFFAAKREFPYVSLENVINHRIKYTTLSPDPKKPYSQRLCSEIIKLCDHDYRRGLNLLSSILTYCNPGELNSSANEKFIQRLIARSAVAAFVRKNHLPNLYEEKFRVGSQTFVVDAFLASPYALNKDFLFPLVNTAMGVRLKEVGIVSKEEEFLMKKGELNSAINYLKNAELIIVGRNNEIELTQKGSLLHIYMTREPYFELFKNICGSSQDDSEFWAIMGVQVDHQKIFRDFHIWRHQQ
ncbi:MAG: hypothetical protein KQH53_18160 [Desulfarculaceae bacterium]|nr:hypothetical protein [Desulfarculaceae bacterium]